MAIRQPFRGQVRSLAPILLALIAALLVQIAAADEHEPLVDRVEGRIVAMASSVAATSGEVIAPPSFSLLLETETGPLHVTLAAGARLVDAQGSPIVPGTLAFGILVRVAGVMTETGHFVADELTVLS